MRRVVITGVGLQTPLGGSLDEVFDALLADRSGVVPMPAWSELDGMRTLVGAPLPNFDGKVIPRKYRRTMGRVAQIAVVASLLAVKDAGLDEATLTGGRTMVVAGSTVGSASAEATFWSHLLIEKNARRLRSTLFFHGMAHTCAANIALMLGVSGEVMATNAACASSTQAIGVAADRIRAGRADVALAGGAEELHISSGVVFQALSAATTANADPSATPRPFDKGRDGIVVGEGAGIFVLEAREHALARGANIIGEVLGYGTSCDARHMSSPEPAGMVSAIQRCLDDSGAQVGRGIDYVNAHATGTLAGDAAEAIALMRSVGDGVPVSSSKGHLGHLLGGCGVVESAICVAAMQRGIAPATHNLVEPDVAPIMLLKEPLTTKIDVSLNTSFAFGGVNAVLLLGSARVAAEDPWS
jgi:3-oxoacyl-[acyl-carrier-protein] synthase II